MQTYLKHTEYSDEQDFKRLQFIVDTIRQKAKPNARILDIGCGNGNISKALGSLGYDVLGIDFSKESIAYAQRTNPFSNVTFRVQSAEEVKQDDIYDVVICSEVLEHLNQPESLVSVIADMVKPGNLLIVTVPNGWGPRELLITKPVQYLSKTSAKRGIDSLKKLLGYANGTIQSSSDDLTHIQFFTKGALKKLIAPHNFKLVRFGHANFIEHVFPYSILANRVRSLSKLDNKLADALPSFMVSGFASAWVKQQYRNTLN